MLIFFLIINCAPSLNTWTENAPWTHLLVLFLVLYWKFKVVKLLRIQLGVDLMRFSDFFFVNLIIRYLENLFYFENSYL